MNGELVPYLAIGAGLFALGAIGFFTRRNMILMVLSAELMLHGVAVTMVTFGRMHNTHEGQAFAIFVLTVAACEAGLALSLLLALYQKTRSLDIDLWTELREPDLPSPIEQEPAEIEEPESVLPKLTPAGHAPVIAEEELNISASAPSK
jgi:NADH-quinone oxidoreductase subunit K